MNKYTLLLNDILKQRKTYLILKKYNQIMNSNRETVLLYQFNKMKKLLLHAERNVPFYQRRFKSVGFSANKFKSLDQLDQIPPLTRYDLQHECKDILASNYKLSKLRKGSSSGATGLPVSYYKDSIASSAGQAANLLGWSLCGWEMGMKGLHIWGNPSTVNKEWKRASSRIKAKLIRHHKFPACQIVESQKFKELYELVIKQRYEYLDGYTNAIYLFAEYLKQNCLNINHIVKYVLTTAENLQEHQRRTIQETIAPVYDTYGCSEINGIAYECSICNNYHVIDPHVYLEYGDKIDDNGSHSLYITDLDNYSFPLIRYKNDDLGIPATDSVSQCNIPFSSIANVTGRQSDIIKLPGGGILSVPSFFGSMLLKNINGLKQYQIEKVEHDMIFVNLVITNEYSDKDRVIIHSALREYLAGKIRYKVRYVDRLEPSPTGKHKLVIDRTLIT